MHSHPLNLLVRFLLEIAAIISMAAVGWALGEGWIAYVGTWLLPLIAIVVWGIFNVPGDPSRSGKAPIKVSGKIRIMIEIAFFSTAIFGRFWLGHDIFAWSLLISILIHYGVSYQRIIWLWRQD